MAEHVVVFSVGEVKEGCEFEPVRMAIGVLWWASAKPSARKALLMSRLTVT